MSTLKEDFFKYLGQTTPQAMGVEISHARGCYLYGPAGEEYIDLISGFSVNNIGHSHPAILEAIREQSGRYLHTMVYGEYIQSPQVEYAKLLLTLLPDSLNQVYFVNSGSEAIEGAVKLAKRATGRHRLVSFRNSYHGSTQGALSLMGSERFKSAFRPLLPGITLLDFNQLSQLERITEETAAVVIEPIQAEAGVVEPLGDFLKQVRKRCNETGTLLIFDEVQTGFGRTGHLFALEAFGITPDILVLAKALGGGLPLGAFIANRDLMRQLSFDPVLGHITTFGGHPLSCAAGMAALKVILSDQLFLNAGRMGQLLKEELKHPLIKGYRGRGLLLAFTLETQEQVDLLFRNCRNFGFLFDLHLFDSCSFRVAPPLNITGEETRELIKRLKAALDWVKGQTT